MKPFQKCEYLINLYIPLLSLFGGEVKLINNNKYNDDPHNFFQTSDA